MLDRKVWLERVGRRLARAEQRVQVRIARDLLRRCRQLTREANELEREVAVLVARGKSNREIAEALVLGERTVQTHVGNILNKLGLDSRTAAAAHAVRRRLV